MPDPPPIPMRLICAECHALHINEGEFATKPHHTHACQFCGNVWRPAVVPTVGVQFLPGFRTLRVQGERDALRRQLEEREAELAREQRDRIAAEQRADQLEKQCGPTWFDKVIRERDEALKQLAEKDKEPNVALGALVRIHGLHARDVLHSNAPEYELCISTGIITLKESLQEMEKELYEARAEIERIRRIRPEVLWFAERMEEKLRANDHKSHWSTCSRGYLMVRLCQELDELKLCSAQDVVGEAADVANLAMMIADNSRRTPDSGQEEK